ncbi:uncharacterized protein CLUP02_09735 [Colletotrichum lupini]|uniref:Uncharacterized protein n=1 Tax=Colletotrichum lupini TaxID=145971 RepID=A0A9Q8SVA1_9PEZI|nr:uncharacterized protein CLUP02_09735 [Colletotrichum lupini]UQC84239.1 hypothetical protein CLUP02_09735 [Colletotrichum lupini]
MQISSHAVQQNAYCWLFTAHLVALSKSSTAMVHRGGIGLSLDSESGLYLWGPGSAQVLKDPGASPVIDSPRCVGEVQGPRDCESDSDMDDKREEIESIKRRKRAVMSGDRGERPGSNSQGNVHPFSTSVHRPVVSVAWHTTLEIPNPTSQPVVYAYSNLALADQTITLCPSSLSEKDKGSRVGLAAATIPKPSAPSHHLASLASDLSSGVNVQNTFLNLTTTTIRNTRGNTPPPLDFPSTLDGLRHAHRLGMHLNLPSNYLSTLADAAESGSNVAKLLPLCCRETNYTLSSPAAKVSSCLPCGSQWEDLWENASRRMQKPGTPVPVGCNGQSPNRPKNRFPIQGKDMRRLGLALGPCLHYRHPQVFSLLRRGPPNPLEQCSSRLPGSLLHLSGEGRHFSHARRLTFESKHASSPCFEDLDLNLI